MSHTGGTLSLGASLFNIGAGTFDGYIAISAIANSDSANRPRCSGPRVPDLGIKYMAPVGDVIHLGLFTELWLINGTGSVGLSGGGTSAKFGAVATADLRGTPTSSSHVPLRFSANVVYSLDNTGAVLQDTENARGEPVTRIERYGLGVNRVDHFDFLLGGEAFIADERVRPFVEGRITTPNNRQNYACHVTNPSQDNCLATDTVVPSVLTLGSRFFPGSGASLSPRSTSASAVRTTSSRAPAGPCRGALSRRRLGGRHLKSASGRRVLCSSTGGRREGGGAWHHVTGFVPPRRTERRDRGRDRDLPRSQHVPLATGADGKFGDEVPPGTIPTS